MCRDILLAKRNKCKRKLEVDDTCDICGMDAECSFHAVIVCPKELQQQNAPALKFAE
jgi:hypothetical protein